MGKFDKSIQGLKELINTNETGIGYEDGYNQAVSGFSPDYSDMVKKGTVLKWILGGDFALKTYIDGYKKGYQLGLENKFSVQKVAVANAEPFVQNRVVADEGGGQSVMVSIMALVGLYNFLVTQCCDALQKVKGQIKTMVDEMESTGVAVELCRELRVNYFPKDFSSFDALHEAIVGHDLKMIADFLDKQVHTYFVITGESNDMELKQPIDIIDVEIEKANGVDVQYQELGVRAVACGRLIASLEIWAEHLTSDMEQYDEYCDRLLTSGMPREYYDTYIEQCAVGNMTMMQSIVEHIKSDIDYLNNVYQAFRQEQVQ